MSSRFLAAVAVALAVSACSSVDRRAMTTFVPTDGGFVYSAATDAIYPADSAEAEKTRMVWLQEYLDLNGVCPKGYDIADRKPVLVSRGPIADFYRIHYTGRCR